ncbi:MAG: hypothetical protein Q7J98_13065, partial [Kiritimatiellia bacterium]|nr:hypothetical protein [Kiritimatiellia bacterium]
MKSRLLLILLSPILLPFAVQATVIKNVEVVARGIKVVDRDFVLANISVRAGDEANQPVIARDVKTLLATGQFSFIDAELNEDKAGDGYILTYIVSLKPKLEKPV